MSPEKWIIVLDFMAAILGALLLYFIGLGVFLWGYRTALRDERAAATPEGP